MKDMRGLMDSIIPISDFSKGKAPKIIQQVNEEGREFIIVKNNEPQAVILPIAVYTELMNAYERMRELDSQKENHNRKEGDD